MNHYTHIGLTPKIMPRLVSDILVFHVLQDVHAQDGWRNKERPSKQATFETFPNPKIRNITFDQTRILLTTLRGQSAQSTMEAFMFTDDARKASACVHESLY